MQRAYLNNLLNWLEKKDRCPLVLRGARQTGKTWLVRELATKSGKQLVELNFEQNPGFRSLFDSNNPRDILLALEASLNRSIDVNSSLLFLDEIQVYPELLAKLRWFAEELGGLPVIAAGSLLDFVLHEHEFSMPVGRINYCHLHPMSFTEFLLANKAEKLVNYLQAYEVAQPIPQLLHQQLLQALREYMFVGGLPQAVKSWANNRSLADVSEIHHNLLTTYRDDFAKYSGRISIMRLEELLIAVPKMLGKKFKFSHVNKDMQAQSLKKALALLCKARLCTAVNHSDGGGIPLGASSKTNRFKMLFLDVGLAGSSLGLSWSPQSNLKEVLLVNEGALAEQMVGQMLVTLQPWYQESALYYWLREQQSSSAEIDYLIQQHTDIIAIEVKAGSTGTLRSLHLFMQMRKLKTAIRLNTDLPNLSTVQVQLHDKTSVNYRLLSLPIYLAEQIPRLWSIKTST